jgi:hypothetical protein
MGTALKAAWDAKIAKEGEVTILRKTIDKVRSCHSPTLYTSQPLL